MSITQPQTSLARLDHAAWLTSLLPRRPIEVANPFELRTVRLVLRPLEARDRAEFTRALGESREHLSRFFPLHHEGETDAQVFERQLAYSEAAVATDQRLAWRRVAFDHDDKLVGAFNLNAIVRSTEQGDHAELAVWIAHGRTGKGFATEGILATLSVAFDQRSAGLGLDWVFGYVSPENLPSLKLCRRIGFGRDMKAPEVELDLGGEWSPHWTFRLRAPKHATRE